jgi:hypothetical protein
MSTPETYKTLVLSTSHVTEATARRFNGRGSQHSLEDIDGHMTDWASYGWIFYCHDNDDTTPAELMACAAFARALGCRYIQFDCDADPLADLPSWEW